MKRVELNKKEGIFLVDVKKKNCGQENDRQETCQQEKNSCLNCQIFFFQISCRQEIYFLLNFS